MKHIDPRIIAAAAQFPETFGLRGHEGTFRVSLESSYIAPGPFSPESEQYVVLYTEKLWPAAPGVKPGWCSFAKGSPTELASQIVKKGP